MNEIFSKFHIVSCNCLNPNFSVQQLRKSFFSFQNFPLIYYIKFVFTQILQFKTTHIGCISHINTYPRSQTFIRKLFIEKLPKSSGHPITRFIHLKPVQEPNKNQNHRTIKLSKSNNLKSAR